MSDIASDTSEYQEQVLDDLEEIKGSLSDEENETDEEYQKKVLGSLRSLEKSVQALSDDTVDLNIVNYSYGYLSLNVDGHVYSIIRSSSHIGVYWFNITNIDEFYVAFSSDVSLAVVLSSYGGSGATNASCVLADTFNFISNEPIKFINYQNSKYLLLGTKSDISAPTNFHVYYYKSENPDAPEQGIIEQIDYTEPLDTLIQISTFQGYASALLIGILLFLIFVKGVRK